MELSNCQRCGANVSQPCPIRVLLVEDNRSDYLLLRQLLSQIEGQAYKLEWVKTFEEALEAIGEDRHEVTLLDYRLGERTGIELLKTLGAGGHGPILFITGQGDHEVDMQAMEAGAADYLDKSRLDGSTLERVIRYALERQRLLATLQVMATHDDLTGLFNRREFNRLTQEELERHVRYERPFSLLILDVDHFKEVNDTFGHAAGDAVLKHIATLLRQTVRHLDRPARLGGDEFAVLLPEATTNMAFRTAERLREAMDDDGLEFLSASGVASTIRFTVSIGVANCPADADTLDGALHAADTALYEAKRQSRNRTVCFTPISLA